VARWRHGRDDRGRVEAVAAGTGVGSGGVFCGPRGQLQRRLACGEQVVAAAGCGWSPQLCLL
jgi:hypothetical protein